MQDQQPGVHHEREVKLAVAAGFHVPPLDDLDSGTSATALEDRRLLTVYWDTPDLRLIRWGCALRHRPGEGWIVKLPSSGPSDVMVRTELSFAGEPARPPEAALRVVRAYSRGAPVAAVLKMRTLRRPIRLHDADGHVLAELDDDEVSVYSGRRLAARFREIEVELTDRGGQEFLTSVVDRLRAAGAGAPTLTPKLVRALGDRAAAPPDVVNVPAGRSSRASDVIKSAVAASVIRLVRHDPGVRLGGDPEDVHQARVAVRRLRSDLGTFASLLDPMWAESLRSELRWLGAELGAVRDADVLSARMRSAVESLPERDRIAGRQVIAGLSGTSSDTRERLLAVLCEPRYLALLDSLVDAAAHPLMAQDGPAADVLPGLVGRSWRRLRSDARQIDGASPDQDLHRLRIRAKRCRYAAEASQSVMGRRARTLAARAAALQEVLGEHQDAVVAADWLRTRAASGADRFVAGELAGLELAGARDARNAWPAAWRRLARRRVTSWCRGRQPVGFPPRPHPPAEVALSSIDGGLAT